MTQIRFHRTTVKKPYVHHEATVGGDGYGVCTGHGFSKCSPQDQWDSSLGRELAELRAKVDAYEQYSALLATMLNKARSKAPVVPVSGLFSDMMSHFLEAFAPVQKTEE
jgi:hypothetical protein